MSAISTIIIAILGLISAILGVKLLGKDNDLKEANKTITAQQNTIINSMVENKGLEANKTEAREQATVLAEDMFTAKKERDIALRLNPILVGAVAQYAKNKLEADNLKAQVIEYENKQNFKELATKAIGEALTSNQPVQEVKQPIQPSEYNLVNHNINQEVIEQPIDDELASIANALVEKAMRSTDNAD